MVEYSSDQVLRNIYGSSATQETLSMLGGNMTETTEIPYKPRKYNIFYVDEFRDQESKVPIGSLMGGARRKKAIKKYSRTPNKMVRRNRGGASKDVIIYNGIEYIPNDDITTFLKEFYLYWRMSRLPTSSIIVIPSKDTLKKMISEARKMVGNDKLGTTDARRIITEGKDKIGYPKYIFTVYGDNTSNDEYKISAGDNADSEYPNAEFPEIRRTNLNMDVYYMSYVSPTKINISATRGGKGKELTFIARGAMGLYVFQGDLPDPVEKFSNTFVNFAKKKRNGRANSKSMKGGSARTIGNFAELCNEFRSIDDAALHFANNMSKNNNMNGDLVYTMFKSAFDDPGNACDIMEKESGGNFDDTFDQIQNYTPISSSMKAKIEQNISNLKQLSNSKHYKRNIVENIKTMYGGNISSAKADIATALYRNGCEDCADIVNIADSIDNSSMFNKHIQQHIANSYIKYPATSIYGRENSNLVCKARGKKPTKQKEAEVEEIITEIDESEGKNEEEEEKVEIEETIKIQEFY